jgi:type II secretory pathway component GspD/PulD (secretin)
MRRNILAAFVLAIVCGPVDFQFLTLDFGLNTTACAAQSDPTQNQEAPTAAPAPAPDSIQNPEAAPQAASPASSTTEPIRFNFKGATFEQVIEFFSRTTGLPVIWQTDVPHGTLDYISPNGYDRGEALRVLNMILQSKGVMLRISNHNLYLQKLDQMQREDIPTFIGKIPAEVTPDQVITVVRPLKIALAKPMAEKLANLVAAYGGVLAMEQQNSLVITETAANAQRILTMVEQLDQEDPEGAVEIFSIKHARSTELMVPLKALLSQKIEKFVINQQGQQVKIEEDQMPGLTISADERTNSIIAKGVQNKINKLREAIELLDIPAAAGIGMGRSMTTIALAAVTPAEAVAKLNALYQRIEEKNRPTVIALDDAAKVMIVGSDAAVTEGSLLIGELENGPVVGHSTQPMMSVIPLQRANPSAVIGAITSLLNKRQQSVTKLVAGPDGKSLVVSGASADVDAVKALVPLLDRQAVTDRQVRVVRIASGDAASIYEQARQMFDAATDEYDLKDLGDDDQGMEAFTDPSHTRESLASDLDVESRVVTLIGPPKAVDAFTAALKQIESTVIIDREARRFVLANVLPSELVGPLTGLAPQLLQPADGSQYIAPNFAPVDQLNTLVVSATPQQLTTLAPLIESLDVAGGEAVRPSPMLMQLRFADASNLANVLNAQYNLRTAAERKTRPVYIGADPQTNSLLVSAHPDVLPEINAMVDQLNTIERLDSEARELQIYPLKVARAEELARTIEEMFPQPPVPLDVRGRPQPQLQKPRPVIVRAEPQTNSLIISALPGVLNLTQEMIAQLDIDPSQASGAAAKSVQVLVVENADAGQIAANLDAMFNAPGHPGGGGPQSKPTIRVDAASNSLLIRATDAQYQMIQEVVAKIDKATIASSRQMRMVAIDPSKATAEEVARSLQRMLDRGDGSKVQVISLEELIEQRTKDVENVKEESQ